MVFRVNGEEVGVATEGRTMGDALAELDERAEAMGAVIVELRLDGESLDPNAIAEASERAAEEAGLVELSMIPAADLREGGLRTLLELVAAAAAAASSDDGEALEAAREAWASFQGTYAGLLSAEEASFVEAFGECLAGRGGDVAATAERLSAFFGERLAELADPVAAMRSAASLFDAIKGDLSEVPVRLQTGKDADAMKTMVIAVELINKTVRVLPEFSRALSAGGRGDMTVEGASLSEFYASLNGVLRELAGAFESKDGVLIGDLAEYEIRPRLDAFYRAALAAAGG